MKQYLTSLMTSDKLLLISTLVFLDQLTKNLFYDHRRVDYAIFITPVFNHGITWWYLLPKPLIFTISCTAMCLFYRLYRKRSIRKVVYILLMAGTIGNLLDRIVLWWVRDFIDLQFFPVFNLADIYLTVAMIITCIIVYHTWQEVIKQA